MRTRRFIFKRNTPQRASGITIKINLLSLSGGPFWSLATRNKRLDFPDPRPSPILHLFQRASCMFKEYRNDLFLLAQWLVQCINLESILLQ